jgi:hypothetical protein
MIQDLSGRMDAIPEFQLCKEVLISAIKHPAFSIKFLGLFDKIIINMALRQIPGALMAP